MHRMTTQTVARTGVVKGNAMAAVFNVAGETLEAPKALVAR